ncbi:unnamed protein product, partial [Ixodes pacificus]
MSCTCSTNTSACCSASRLVTTCTPRGSKLWLLAMSLGNMSWMSNLKVTVLPLDDSSWHSTTVPASTERTRRRGHRSGWPRLRRLTFLRAFSRAEALESVRSLASLAESRAEAL